MSYIIVGIQPEQIDEVWSQVERWVQDALDYGSDLSTDDVNNKLQTRLMQLWIVLELPIFKSVACYITEIDDMPSGYILNTTCLGGDGMGDWLHLVEKTICDFAKYSGCNYVSLDGRRGWTKELKKYNWRETTVRMIKEV